MLSGWQFILGGAVMMIFGAAFGGKISGFTVKSTLLLIYLALISAVAYSLWSILLKYNPVSKVAVCGFMTPVSAMRFLRSSQVKVKNGRNRRRRIAACGFGYDNRQPLSVSRTLRQNLLQ